MRHQHLHNPFHHVSFWTGTYFRAAGLWEVGVYIIVPHHPDASLCPTLTFQRDSLEVFQVLQDNAVKPHASGFGTFDTPADNIHTPSTTNLHEDHNDDLPANMPRRNMLNNPYVRVVHTNGIHYLPLVTCACHGADAVHADLIYNLLVPASFSRYRTLFTVAMLDDFRILNLECKASAYQYFQQLRCLTCPMDLNRVLDLYHELLRISRLW